MSLWFSILHKMYFEVRVPWIKEFEMTGLLEQRGSRDTKTCNLATVGCRANLGFLLLTGPAHPVPLCQLENSPLPPNPGTQPHARAWDRSAWVSAPSSCPLRWVPLGSARPACPSRPQSPVWLGGGHTAPRLSIRAVVTVNVVMTVPGF